MPSVEAYRLHYAAADGDTIKIKRFLKAGDDVNKIDDDWRAPLAYAVHYKQTDAVRLLLAAGADPSLHDKKTKAPLYLAAEAGDATITKLLIDAKADLNDFYIQEAEMKSWTPLNASVCSGHHDVVRLLIESGCDLENNEENGIPPISCAAINGHVSIVSTLIQAGANIHVSCSSRDGGIALLSSVVVGGHLDVAKELIQMGAQIDQRDMDGLSPIHHAARKGHNDIVKLLVSSGAEVDSRTGNLVTPFHLASQFGRQDTVYTLLSFGADVLAKDIKGTTALDHAILDGYTEVMELLRSAGLPVSIPERSSPLFLATARGHAKAAKLLLDAGANPNNIVSPFNQNPLFYAASFEMIKVLLEGGTSVSIIDTDGRSVLHVAGSRGLDTACICALFKAKANPTLLDNEGRTAADCARIEGHHDAAKLLDLLAAKHRAMNPPATAPSSNDDEKKSEEKGAASEK